MLQNYLKIAWRNLIKNRVLSSLNILGITIGFACCLLIFTYVQNELSYDRYHSRKDRIFRLATEMKNSSFENGIAKVSGPWGLTAQLTIPEIEKVVRFVFASKLVLNYDEKQFYESNGFFADAGVFNVFSWNLEEGNLQKALSEPNTIILSRSMANKYFGNSDPIGKVLRTNNEEEYRVTGVLADVPANSHFTFDYLISMATLKDPEQQDWVRFNHFYTYFLLKDGASYPKVEGQLKHMLTQNMKPGEADMYTPFLQPLTSIHLYSKLFREIGTGTDVRYLYIFGFVGLFILLIASINFINLSTARASLRAKEVGVRKTSGAAKSALVYQFLAESLLTSVLAAVLAIAFAYIGLHFLNSYFGWSLKFDFLNPALVSTCLVMILFVGIISGSYPAFVMSAFNPIRALSGQVSVRSNAFLRSGLVVFQFAISVFMIIATLVIISQQKFIQTKNLGFDKEQIITIELPDHLQTPEKIEYIKQELEQTRGVVHISASGNRPGGSDYGMPVDIKGFTPATMPAMRCLVVDEDFLKTYDIKIAEGRGFSRNFPSDRQSYLINETAAKALGWKNPLQQKIGLSAVGRPEGDVIGVVKDFHFRSMHEAIAPLYIFMEPSWFSQISIKLNTTELPKTLSALDTKWKRIVPDVPFAYSFFDEEFEALHQSEQRTMQIVSWFTMIAIFVSCLGLFGITTLLAEQRTKEIGIRKVLGASVTGITMLLSKDFLVLVLVSVLIASPLAWYFMDQWLADFAYRISISWWMFAVAGILAVTIALVTVSFQAVKAALMNPVKSLRSE
ncbi:ABC transporter permease [Telluribacter sp.]|jgi:putative ABC transport system permease protein|uniref:ABC transporter permease n=1 Tax=Telluribacter sp. TaxID=1978767 RepID=UPI002E1438FB|nr:ABC transporter permease [Telluribacter sp.]